MKKGIAILLIFCLTAGLLVMNVSASGSADCVVENGLMLWLKADSGVGTDEEGYVTEWKDQSGKNHDLVQADDERRPFLTKSSGLKEEQNAVSFRPNQYLVSDVVDYSGSSTLILYYRSDADAFGRTIFSSSQYVGIPNYEPGKAPFTLTNSDSEEAGVQMCMASETGDTINYDTTIPRKSDDFMSVVLVVDHQQRKADVYYNISGDNQTIGMPNATFDLDDIPYYESFALGLKYDSSIVTRGLSGEIAEMMIYDRALDVDELNEINRYLKLKYDIPKRIVGLKVADPKSIMYKGESYEPDILQVVQLMDTEIEIPVSDARISSSNEGVVSVSGNMLTANDAGESLITISCGGGVSTQLIVRVPDIIPNTPVITGFSPNGKLKVQQTFTSADLSGKASAAMLVALYRSETLVDYQWTEGTDLEITFNLPENIDGYRAVIMLVDSMETMKPIAKEVVAYS